MAARGSSFEAGANACPFVALELDRDRRSDRPDYRHRCYAEQVPAPRTVAHQERYCLSPNFSGCPIFQAWAVRAAARPVPIPGGVSASARGAEPAHEIEASYEAGPGVTEVAPAAFGAPPVSPVAAIGADEFDIEEPPLPEPPPAEPTMTEQPPPARNETWPDSMGAPIVPPLEPLQPGAPRQTDTTWSAAVSGGPSPAQEQLSVFDGPVAPTLPVEPLAPAPTFASTLPDEPLTPPAEPATAPHASPAYDDGPDDSPSVPAFLAGRSQRPRATPVRAEPVDRGDLVPSWELDGRFGAEPSARQAPGADRGGMGNVLTAVAVVIIIGLGILAVLLIPGVLGGGGSQPTRRPTNIPTIRTSAQATTVAVVPTATVTPTPTEAQPTAEPTPEASPILYRVKRGDSLERIARRNGTTVQAILDANPQIPGADAIQVGQVIVLPPPVSVE